MHAGAAIIGTLPHAQPRGCKHCLKLDRCRQLDEADLKGTRTGLVQNFIGSWNVLALVGSQQESSLWLLGGRQSAMRECR